MSSLSPTSKSPQISQHAKNTNDKYLCLVTGYVKIEKNDDIPMDIQLIMAKFYGMGWIYSSILNFTEANMLASLLSKQLDIHRSFSLNLLYRSSRDRNGARDFHRLCDGKKDTVTLFKTKNGHIFGGYTDIPWTSNDKVCIVMSKKNKTFIFLLRSNVKYIKNGVPIVFGVKPGSGSRVRAVTHGRRLGPCFGHEDIYVDSTMNSAHTYSGGSFTCGRSLKHAPGKFPLTGNQIPIGRRFCVDRFELFKTEVFEIL